MHHELQLDHACQRLHLRAGTVVHCHAGQVWLTREPLEQHGPSPDIVLTPGQQHRVEITGSHFLTHLRSSGEPVRCSVELPTAQGTLQGALRSAFNLR